jgi:transposase
MDTTTQPVPTKKTTSERQWRTTAEKRQIVEETLALGASVALVARAHGVNANQVFQWRRLYRGGLLPAEENTPVAIAGDLDQDRARLLPVVVSEAAECQPQVRGSNLPKQQTRIVADPVVPALIELKLAKAQVRISGAVDAGVLRSVLECLLR